jgi:hypothetical protein
MHTPWSTRVITAARDPPENGEQEERTWGRTTIAGGPDTGAVGLGAVI